MMKFCSDCGSQVYRAVPEGDTRVRDICTQCRRIFYVNPKVVPGTITLYQNKVLLCRRAINPRHNCWTLPAGFMECGETMVAGALRETWEEACAPAIHPSLYLIANIVKAAQIHVFYRAELFEPTFDAGDETLETRLFSEEEIPWHQLSFRTVFYALYYFFQDRKKDKFPIREISMPDIPMGNYVLQQ